MKYLMKHFQMVASVVTLSIYAMVAVGLSWTECMCPDDTDQYMSSSHCEDIHAVYGTAYSGVAGKNEPVIVAASCVVCCDQEISLDVQEPVQRVTDPERTTTDSRDHAAARPTFGAVETEYKVTHDTHSPPTFCISHNVTILLT